VKYLLLLAGEPGPGPPPGSEDFGQMLADYQRVTEEMAAAHVLLDSGPLDDVSSARTVRAREGSPLVTAGPFAEIREQLGGYYVLDCPDMDAAISWAEKIPAVRFGSVEVRPVMQMPT
jgi:hypothetical protein